MRIKKRCLYRASVWNLLPAIVVTPTYDGFFIALKFMNVHAGVYLSNK